LVCPDAFIAALSAAYAALHSATVFASAGAFPSVITPIAATARNRQTVCRITPIPHLAVPDRLRQTTAASLGTDWQSFTFTSSLFQHSQQENCLIWSLYRIFAEAKNPPQFSFPTPIAFRHVFIFPIATPAHDIF
jgi:hypothetical protein